MFTYMFIHLRFLGSYVRKILESWSTRSRIWTGLKLAHWWSMFNMVINLFQRKLRYFLGPERPRVPEARLCSLDIFLFLFRDYNFYTAYLKSKNRKRVELLATFEHHHWWRILLTVNQYLLYSGWLHMQLMFHCLCEIPQNSHSE